MCERTCDEIRNLDAMHRGVITVLSGRTEFTDEDDARTFFDVGCQFLSSILFAKYRRSSICPLRSEQQ